MQKIKIIKDGPYIVTGNVPLYGYSIIPQGEGYYLKQTEILPQSQTYALCRCGQTKTPPFCDGRHADCQFHGEETASQKPYLERAQKLIGETVDLLDDGRCAFVRFCHRCDGSVWELVVKSGDPHNKEEAIIAASECSAGRLTVVDKDGNDLNIKYEPSIEILQDPEKNVSGPIAVKGGIILEGSDGKLYENRERYALCRCGKSKNKPFCDAYHVLVGYKDK